MEKADFKERPLALSLAMLAFASGSADSFAFLHLGAVFTSAMSGNLILLGLGLGQGHASVVAHAGVSFLSYIVGVLIAAPILHAAMTERLGLSRVLVIEIAFLAVFAIVWFGFGPPADASAPIVFVLLALSACGMGAQAAAARTINVSGISTVVFTGTLTAVAGTIGARLFAGTRPVMTRNARRQAMVIGVYLMSAIATGIAGRVGIGGIPALPAIACCIALGALEPRVR